MARVNVHGNPTDRLRPELKRGEDVSPGSSSEASPEKQPTLPEPSEHKGRGRAKRTESHSSQRRGAGGSTADSADASTVADE